MSLAPEGLEGTSMIPLLEDPERPWKSAAFNQIPRPYLADKDWELMGYSMRTDRYRYTEWVDRDGAVRAKELYDFEIAPFETTNLAEDHQYTSLADSLAKRLQAGWRAARPVSDM